MSPSICCFVKPVICTKLPTGRPGMDLNINELEHHGLDRCPDKGIKGMHRYIGLAVIACNLRRIGKILLEQDRRVSVADRRKAA